MHMVSHRGHTNFQNGTERRNTVWLDIWSKWLYTIGLYKQNKVVSGSRSNNQKFTEDWNDMNNFCNNWHSASWTECHWRQCNVTILQLAHNHCINEGCNFLWCARQLCYNVDCRDALVLGSICPLRVWSWTQNSSIYCQDRGGSGGCWGGGQSGHAPFPLA